jgi:hypothetical protein
MPEKYSEGFERNYNLKIENKEKNIVIKASMLDWDHAITAEIEIEKKTKKIIRAEAKMPKVPHRLICQKALDSLKSIIGLETKRGLTKKLRETVGGNKGCLHIYKLVWLAADLAANYLKRDAAPEEQLEFLKNTCVVYSEEKN